LICTNWGSVRERSGHKEAQHLYRDTFDGIDFYAEMVGGDDVACIGAGNEKMDECVGAFFVSGKTGEVMMLMVDLAEDEEQPEIIRDDGFHEDVSPERKDGIAEGGSKMI
jgi:hypothetical protein